MKLPFSMSNLSLTEGEIFLSHKKKVEEMQSDWQEYPFQDFKLKSKSKKSFVFVRFRSECNCGRRANRLWISVQCSKCCHSSDCKVHTG